MCKYVTDNFSIEMLDSTDHFVCQNQVNKNEFMEEIKDDCVPSIGYKTIANYLKVPRHPIYITLQPGDVIYVISSKFGRNHGMDRKDNRFRYDKYEIVC